jgi:Actinobacteria/chloroflexi VLRF1 release factor
VTKNPPVPAAGGGRWVEVAPERFPGWITSLTRRHGGEEAAVLEVMAAPDGATVTFTAPDGTTAECHPPFAPLARVSIPGTEEGAPGAATDDLAGRWAAAISAHALAERTVGVLLVRLGGYAAGVFAGSPPALVASKSGARPVHGRSAAGGWSQHRFARRREKQAAEALHAATDAAVQVFSRAPGGPKALDAVVLGGDKRAVAPLRGDPRLAPYLALATDRFLTVPDPRLAVLKDTPRLFLAIRVRLTEPGQPRQPGQPRRPGDKQQPE